jgi:hypothetical protein
MQKKVVVRLPSEMAKELKSLTALQGLTIQAVVTDAVQGWIKEQRGGRPVLDDVIDADLEEIRIQGSKVASQQNSQQGGKLS